MKIDIEGSEIELMPDLILSGALSHVDFVGIEWHPKLAGEGQRMKMHNMVRDSVEVA